MSDPKYAYPYPAQGSTDHDLDFKDEKEELLLICLLVVQVTTREGRTRVDRTRGLR
jgi:hypothetical protein